MTKALVINSSASGKASVSGQLSSTFVLELQRGDPSLQVVARDVGASPIPHLTPERLPGLAGKTESTAAAETAALSETLIGELRDADLLVIGAPMYNFGMPSTLKAWFDHVLRAGITFRYTAEGPEGLMTGKRAIVLESRGGLYSEGPAAAFDNQEPHIRTILGFMGITDVTFIRAERLAIGPDARAASIEAALEQVREVASRFVTVAA